MPSLNRPSVLHDGRHPGHLGDTKLRRYWSWLGLNLGKHFGLVTAIGLAVTVALGFGATRLQFKTDNTSLLNTNDPVYVENVKYQAAFGGDDMLAMFSLSPGTSLTDFLSAPNEAKMTAMAARLRAVPGVFDVLSPVSVLSFTSALVTSPNGNVADSIGGKALLAAIALDPSPASRKLRLEDALLTAGNLAKIPVAERTLSNPRWVNFLLHDNQGHLRKAMAIAFPNPTHAQLLVRLDGGQSINAEGATTKAILSIIASYHFQGAATVTTGAPALLTALNDYLKGGMVLLSGIAAVVMLFILVLFFDVRWRLLPFLVVGIGLVWAFGVAGYFGIPLTLATIAGLPIMLGIGIDYAIQMHSRVEEEVVLDRVAHPIQATARNLCPALLIVTLDAVFAFAALGFAHVPLIRQFGKLLVVGVVMICIGSIVLPLAILGIREFRSPTTRRNDFSRGRLARLVVWLGSLPKTVAVPLSILSVLLLAGGIVAEGRLTIQTDAVTWLNQSSQVVRNIHAVEAGTGSANELDAFVQSSNIFDKSNMDALATFQGSIVNRNPGLVEAPQSIASLLEGITYVPGASTVLLSGAEAKAVYDAAPAAIQRLLVTDGGREAAVIFPGRTTSLDLLDPTVNDIKHYAAPAGITISPAGIAAIGAGLLAGIESNRILITYLAILFVFIWLVIRLRSVVRSLLSLVPVLIAVGTSSLLADALGVKLSPATAVGGPLVVAVCTEFTSLILLRFIEERSRGADPRTAMDEAARRTGRAFVVSAMTAVAGIGVIATSSLPLLSSFGLTVALNVSIALVCALVVLPPMLVWADERGWVSRGMLRPDPEARPLAEAGAAQ
jgi:hydrophobe/amphiphile efflux-3 (HAE3) family protein